MYRPNQKVLHFNERLDMVTTVSIKKSNDDPSYHHAEKTSRKNNVRVKGNDLNLAKFVDPIHTDPKNSIAELCDLDDWTEHSIFRYLYLPFGILLLVVRVLVLLGACILIVPFSRNFKCRVLLVVLKFIGIQINRNMNHKAIEQHTSGSIVAINHVSVFDCFLTLVHPNATVLLVKTPGSVGKIIFNLLFKFSGVNHWSILNKRQLVQSFVQWRKAPETISLCVTPEATINNGRGLFSFRPDFLSRGLPVTPTAVSITTPFGISAHPAKASGGKRFIRLFMMPWIRFEVAYLDKKKQAKEQSKKAFATEIQQDIADHLGIPATKWTAKQKHEYLNALN